MIMRNYAKVTKEDLLSASFSVLPTVSVDEVVFLCVGTDRSTGDSFGPMTGTLLTRLGYKNVYGTLHDPVHATNLATVKLPDDKIVIAIDSCLGTLSSLDKFEILKGSLKPGAGVGREDLAAVGDYKIGGIVNVGGFMEYFVLQNTRLSKVVDMSEALVKTLSEVYPLPEGDHTQ